MVHSAGTTIAIISLVGFFGSWIMGAYYSIRLGMSRPASMRFLQAANLAVAFYRRDEFTPDGRRYLKRAWICVGLIVAFTIVIVVAQH